MSTRTPCVAALALMLLLPAACREKRVSRVTVPMVLDHNRMLVDAEMQRQDGSWRNVRLWVDTGNPDFFTSKDLARDLGVDLSLSERKAAGGESQPLVVPPPAGVRIGGMALNFKGVNSQVLEPDWLLGTMHNDANLPSTVLQRYQVVFDYPKRRLTLAEPGSLQPRGERVAARVNPKTGIVQIDADIGGERFSFALDNGASYSFTSEKTLEQLSQRHPDWPRSIGALGCANIWGWWPQEPAWPVLRLPHMQCGPVRLESVGIVGLPNFFDNGLDVGAWYSQKSAGPVNGFLGPNAFKAFRVEIDFIRSAVYFEKGAEFDARDMDLVGLTLQPEPDGGYRVIGVAQQDGKPAVAGVEPADLLIQVGDLQTKGATMGAVVDALRGKPGERRTLVLERSGKRFQVEAEVKRFL